MKGKEDRVQPVEGNHKRTGERVSAPVPDRKDGNTVGLNWKSQGLEGNKTRTWEREWQKKPGQKKPGGESNVVSDHSWKRG